MEKVEGIKAQYQQSLADLESLYGALSQKAFKGELDLSRVPIPEEDENGVVADIEKLNEAESLSSDDRQQLIKRLGKLDNISFTDSELRRDCLSQWIG